MSYVNHTPSLTRIEADDLMKVCTTCIASGYRVLDCVDFPIVFIDEASMSTEPATLIPLMKGVRLHMTSIYAGISADCLTVATSRAHWRPQTASARNHK